jgi:hypothetical protein
MRDAEIAVCIFEASFARCHSPVPLKPGSVVASSDIFVAEPGNRLHDTASTSLAGYAWPIVEKWEAAEVPYAGVQHTRGVEAPLEVPAGLNQIVMPLIIMQVISLSFCTCCVVRAFWPRGEEVRVATTANEVRGKKTDKVHYGMVGNSAPDEQSSLNDNPFDA